MVDLQHPFLFLLVFLSVFTDVLFLSWFEQLMTL